MSQAPTTNSRQAAQVILKALIILLGFVGQLISFARPGLRNGTHFLYYTNISNILAVLVTSALLGLLIRDIKAGHKSALPAWLSRLHFVSVAGILLTFAGFSLLLLPRMSRDYLLSADNILVHNLVPLLAAIDFVLFERPGARLTQRTWQGLLLPLAYCIFALALGLLGVRFMGSVAPYFFLDYRENGWFAAGGGKLGVFWWVLVIAALQAVLSRLLLGLRKGLNP